MDDFGSTFFDSFVSTTPPQGQFSDFTNGGGSLNSLVDSSMHFPTAVIKQEYSNSSASSTSSSSLPGAEVNSLDGNSLDFILDNSTPQQPTKPQPSPAGIGAGGGAMKIPTTKIGVSCIGQNAKTIFIPLQNNNKSNSSLKTVRIIKATSLATTQNNSVNIKSIHSPVVNLKNVIPMQKNMNIIPMQRQVTNVGGYVPQITQRHQLV